MLGMTPAWSIGVNQQTPTHGTACMHCGMAKGACGPTPAALPSFTSQPARHQSEHAQTQTVGSNRAESASTSAFGVSLYAHANRCAASRGCKETSACSPDGMSTLTMGTETLARVAKISSNGARTWPAKQHHPPLMVNWHRIEGRAEHFCAGPHWRTEGKPEDSVYDDIVLVEIDGQLVRDWQRQT